jgi:hypothetical protein
VPVGRGRGRPGRAAGVPVRAGTLRKRGAGNAGTRLAGGGEDGVDEGGGVEGRQVVGALAQADQLDGDA